MYHGIDMPMHEGRELPSITLRQIDLPNVEYWQVGNQYYLVMKVEMTGKRNRKDVNAPKGGRQKIEGDFQVHSIRELDHTPINVDMIESLDFEVAITKAKSGK